MNASYEAVRMPRGNLVVEMPSREFQANLETMVEAEQYANELNRWLKSKPSPLGEHSPFYNTDTPPVVGEYELLAILDRMHDPERQLDLLSMSITRLVEDTLD